MSKDDAFEEIERELAAHCSRKLLPMIKHAEATVATEGKLADVFKLIDIYTKVTGLGAKDRADPYANLPTINVVFDGGINPDPRPPEKDPAAAEARKTLDEPPAELPEAEISPPEVPMLGDVNVEDLLDFDDLEVDE